MSGRGNPVEVQKCRASLLKTLKQPENNRCADCGQKQPTWASTNLGVFVCIRCSGIHRNLGTHISKVKSVNLDSWTYKLVQQFKSKGGNAQVNAYYECSLPSRMKARVSTTTHDLESFIRNKYQHRKWYSDTPREVPEVPSRKKKRQPRVKRTPKPRRPRESNREETTDSAPSDSSSTQKVVSQPSPPAAQVSQELPDLLDVSSLQPETDDLLSFEPSLNFKPSSQPSSFSFISNGHTPVAIAATPSINIAAVGPPPRPPPSSSSNAFGLSDGPPSTFGPSATAFDFSAPGILGTDSKSSILSRYHDDPFANGQVKQVHMSAEFMTQLTPQHPVPVQPQPMGFGYGMGTQMQGYGANPYTMMNGAQKHRQNPRGFGFR